MLIIGWGKDNVSGLDYWTARNSWGDGWGENHLNPKANCSRGECGFFRSALDLGQLVGIGLATNGWTVLSTFSYVLEMLWKRAKN